MTLQQDADEASRAVFGHFMRQPTTLVILGASVLLLLGLVAFGFFLSSSIGHFPFGATSIVIAVAILATLPWRYRMALRRQLAKKIAEGGPAQRITFSQTGVDAASALASAHFNWQAIKKARTIDAGILMQVGGTMVFVSKRSFENPTEYDRTLALLDTMLGTRASIYRDLPKEPLMR